ncbi:MAG: DMT family transporter [Thermoleophilia bacterium]|nr:DMT family transporter [Thermoleophilia bacterium]
MARGYVPLLLLVAGIWGASFMFIKVAVEEIDPVPMIWFRLMLAALVLAPVLVLQLGASAALEGLREGIGGFAFLGFMNSALPFTMIAWGETHIDSSIAAIANAPVPIFVALLALRFRPSERVTGVRLLGILVGFLGVGVLVGFHPEGGWWGVLGTLAVVAAALCYAISNLFASARFGRTSPFVIVTGSSIAGAVMLTPLALVRLPDHLPSAKASGSVVGLGVLGTAIALLFFYRMLNRYGPSRAALVTYLIPPVALVYGVVLLDERLTASALLGLVLILGGVALGSGVARFSRRRAVVPVAPRP